MLLLKNLYTVDLFYWSETVHGEKKNKYSTFNVYVPISGLMYRYLFKFAVQLIAYQNRFVWLYVFGVFLARQNETE